MSEVSGYKPVDGAVTTSRASSSVSSAQPAKVAHPADVATAEAIQPKAQSLAPKVEPDPFAGLIIQYLDKGGDVVSQIPSTLALSYLRVGLTASGTKPEDFPPIHDITT